MSAASKPTNTPPQMSAAEIVDVVLDGIAGQRRSFARWALMELADRLAAAKGISQRPDVRGETHRVELLMSEQSTLGVNGRAALIHEAGKWRTRRRFT